MTVCFTGDNVPCGVSYSICENILFSSVLCVLCIVFIIVISFVCCLILESIEVLCMLAIFESLPRKPRTTSNHR